jgi:uncharacterized protein
MDVLFKAWPWYVTGPVIGLSVPLLLLLGNKKLGVSSTLRQVCAACFPGKIPFLNYNWKKDVWNLYLVGGMVIGGFLGGSLLTTREPIDLSESTVQFLNTNGLSKPEGLMPTELFNWETLATLKGIVLMVAGGFMVGFGTRYARGCTSGHGILGLSALQWPSLVATCSFFLGGTLFSYFILPFILSL